MCTDIACRYFCPNSKQFSESETHKKPFSIEVIVRALSQYKDYISKIKLQQCVFWRRLDRSHAKYKLMN